MAVTRLSIQLPAQSYSFTLSLPSQSTVSDLKKLISQACPGSPKPEGQRVICKGRVLDDSSVVGELWPSQDEVYTIHLSVHPSAWTSTPPAPSAQSATVQAQPQSQSQSQSQPSLSQAPLSPLTSQPVIDLTPVPFPTIQPLALTCIHYIHSNALRALAQLPLAPWTGTTEYPLILTHTKVLVEACGRTWPPILEFPYPVPSANDGPGARYAVMTADALPYLVLQTANAEPTQVQRHAMAVLTYTFPLLNSLSLIPSPVYRPLSPRAGVPTAPAAPHPLGPGLALLGGALPRIPQVRLRALIAPVLLLAFRASLLLYFFSPARRPFFALLVALWALFELYGAIRAAAAVDGGNRAADAQGPGAAALVANDRPQAPNRAGRPAEPHAPAPGGLPLARSQDILSRLSLLNWSSEAQVLLPGAAPVPRPSWFPRAQAFISYFFLTMHPAYWDRRRRALRSRETLLKQTFPTSDTAEHSGEGAVARNPSAGWATEYVERVRNTEWIDE